MHRALKMLISASAILVISGCVSMISLSPNAADGQSLRYYSGAGLVTSTGNNCSIIFGPLDEVQNAYQDSVFFIAITNHTNLPVLTRPSDIRALSPGPWGSTISLQVVDRGVEKARIEQQRAADQFGAVLIGLSSAVQPNEPTTQQGYVTGPGGTSYIYTKTDNPAARTQAQQQGINNMLDANKSADIRYTQGIRGTALLFASNTIMPGETYNAILAIKPPSVMTRKDPVVATYKVHVCDETHIFTTTYRHYQIDSN